MVYAALRLQTLAASDTRRWTDVAALRRHVRGRFAELGNGDSSSKLAISLNLWRNIPVCPDGPVFGLPMRQERDLPGAYTPGAEGPGRLDQASST